MSKTMDRDGPVTIARDTLINMQAAEIERLKADYSGLFFLYNEQSTECRNLSARVEELEALNVAAHKQIDMRDDVLDERHDRVSFLEKERDTLKQRVEELEVLLNTANAWHVTKERDDLREKLSELNRIADVREKMLSDLQWIELERDELRAQLELIKGETMSYRPGQKFEGIHVTNHDARTKALRDENARLKAQLDSEKEARHNVISRNGELLAELAALKPVPVVEVQERLVSPIEGLLHAERAMWGYTNLKLTFTDGKLTGAEVVG